MKTPHVHAELIKAWADGAPIQYRAVPHRGDWVDASEHLIWDWHAEYRIKPEPKPDQVVYPVVAQYRGENGYGRAVSVKDQLKLTFDSETGKLKSAEVL
jgi:hypothetical protein